MINLFKKIYCKVFLKTNFDVGLRYFPVVDYLMNQKLKNQSILEVGSSSTGVASFLKCKVTGADINFPVKPLKNLTPVKITGVKLPFKKNSFDYVVCVDTLEHIERTKRLLIISEMIRVAKKCVLIVVPCGKKAGDQDRMLLRLYQNTYKQPFSYLVDHLQYHLPVKNEMDKYINKALAQNRKTGSIITRPVNNLLMRGSYMKIEMTADNKLRQFLAAFLSLLLPLVKHINISPCYRIFYLIKFTR